MILSAALVLIMNAYAEEESIRDKAVRNARRVEADVLRELNNARESACKAVKGKECVPEKKSQESSEKNP